MTRTSIVLLRGMLGISRLLWWEYFHGAPRLLQDMGFSVIVPDTPWGEPIGRRSAFLAEALKDCEGPLHLVGHSMGGVDARHYITHHGGHAKVASLTTLSSPHRGSILATQVMADPFSPWRRIPSVADLTREAMARFNRDTPDMPGIVYRSYTAARPLDEHPWWVRPYGRRIAVAEGDNDAQVSVSSARWGEHIDTLHADHYELIGSQAWFNPFRHREPFRHLPVFRAIGEWVRDFETIRRHPEAT